MSIWLLFLSIYSIGIHASHFNGGTITWAPINPNANSSSVDITITQSYSWSYPTVTCTTDVPVSSSKPGGNLTCVANCSTDGGYSTAPISILTDCTSSSSALGTMSSERSVNVTLSTGAYFYVAYKGSAWRDLYTTTTSGLDWSIASLIDLRLRSDGIINTPPVANVVSPQYIIVNTTTLIDISVSDVNTDDDVRCRWAVNQGSGSIDECSNICYPGGLPNDTILSNCTISFTGLVPNTWYPIAVQVEDFINETSTEPMSSVPVQILIYVQATPSCTILPVMVSLTDCLEVQAGVTTNFTLYVSNLCNSSATITEVIISKKISGMTASSVKNSTTNTLSYIQLSWTPQSSQIGTQEMCAYAYNSLLVRSTQYCVTFTVTASSPYCPTTTVAGASMTTVATSNTGMNIPLIVGLSLLALSLALCCCGCWLYHFFWGSRGRRRRVGKQEEEKIEQQKYSQRLPLFITRNLPFKTLNKNYLFRQISNNHDSTSTLRLSAPTSLLSTSKNQVSFIVSENDRNHNIEQSFAKESMQHNASYHHNNKVTRVLRNKVSTVCNTAQLNDSQRKDKSNNISGDLTIEDTNASIYYNESMNAIKLNEDETSAVRKSRIISVNLSATVARRRSHSINARIGSQPITGKRSSKIGSVTVTRVRSFSNNNRPRKSNGTSIFPEDNGRHTNNKIDITSVRRHKSKTRSYRSKYQKN
ncbi:unnamed protein product [Rotaria sp. Silwood2]|nr:unnamed protein product [Rotaria sp. Silwood2]CAF3128459.1 unnamed protein product [Rotaria sp. Silwood2]CAF4110620.1 unnamed protein product [Rotaria sp. Silwood2]CAF4129744.1 unnamed protein product [Rotaria sp. Silwood2]